jgi:hypothetical protein
VKTAVGIGGEGTAKDEGVKKSRPVEAEVAITYCADVDLFPAGKTSGSSK